MVDIWVCNSSPLISLSRIRRLDLIESLGATVLVPVRVMEELEAGNRDPAAQTVRNSSRLHVVPDVEVPEMVRSWRLDPGESQVLASALEQTGRGVVLDDRAARRCAALASVPMVGTVGLVAFARHRGILKAAARIYRALMDAGLFLSPARLKAVLAGFDEAL